MNGEHTCAAAVDVFFARRRSRATLATAVSPTGVLAALESAGGANWVGGAGRGRFWVQRFKLKLQICMLKNLASVLNTWRHTAGMHGFSKTANSWRALTHPPSHCCRHNTAVRLNRAAAVLS